MILTPTNILRWLDFRAKAASRGAKKGGRNCPAEHAAARYRGAAACLREAITFDRAARPGPAPVNPPSPEAPRPGDP